MKMTSHAYLYKSWRSGYSIVTHGPKSDFKNVACETNSAIFASSDLNLSGTYGIRIESRENNELGNDHTILSWTDLYERSVFSPPVFQD